MSLDPRLWTRLEAHGVSEEHLDMLLRLLDMQRSGSWAWHYVNGQLTQCDVRLVFPSRAREVERVCEGMLGGQR